MPGTNIISKTPRAATINEIDKENRQQQIFLSINVWFSLTLLIIL